MESPSDVEMVGEKEGHCTHYTTLQHHLNDFLKKINNKVESYAKAITSNIIVGLESQYFAQTSFAVCNNASVETFPCHRRCLIFLHKSEDGSGGAPGEVDSSSSLV